MPGSGPLPGSQTRRRGCATGGRCCMRSWALGSSRLPLTGIGSPGKEGPSRPLLSTPAPRDQRRLFCTQSPPSLPRKGHPPAPPHPMSSSPCFSMASTSRHRRGGATSGGTNCSESSSRVDPGKGRVEEDRGKLSQQQGCGTRGWQAGPPYPWARSQLAPERLFRGQGIPAQMVKPASLLRKPHSFILQDPPHPKTGKELEALLLTMAAAG